MILTPIFLLFLLIFISVFLLTKRSLKPSKQYACGEDMDIQLSSGGFFRVLQQVLSGVFSSFQRLHQGGVTTYLTCVFFMLFFLSLLAVLL